MSLPRKGTPEYEAWKNSPAYEEWQLKVSEYQRNNPNSGRFDKDKVPWNKGKQTGQVPPNKGIPMSDEQKAKISAAKRGTPRKPEDIVRAADSNRGRKRTPEQKARMSEAQKGRKMSPDAIEKMAATKRGKPSHMKGKTHTPATRAKLSASLKGRTVKGHPMTPENRKRMSESNFKRWQNTTEDQKRKHLDKLHEAARDITKSSIEEIYAKRLDEQGVTYERQKRIGWYRVDFYIPSENKIVEVEGCYWHCCEQCGYADKHPGKREKDAKRYEYLRRKGYTVETVWEHELR